MPYVSYCPTLGASTKNETDTVTPIYWKKKQKDFTPKPAEIAEYWQNFITNMFAIWKIGK